jgi:hypothetical protein
LGFTYTPKPGNGQFRGLTLLKKTLLKLGKLDLLGCEIGISVKWYNK